MRAIIDTKTRRSVYRQYNKAIMNGDLVKPDGCSKCGKVTTIHGHHPDYTKPLEVVWVCVSCHGTMHRLNGDGGGGRGRAMYCEDDLWRTAKRHASELGFVSISDWIRGLMVEAMKEGE